MVSIVSPQDALSGIPTIDTSTVYALLPFASSRMPLNTNKFAPFDAGPLQVRY